MSNYYISIAIILFLLSMISERVADFLKNFLSETNTGFGAWLGRLFGMGDLISKKVLGSRTEEKRSFNILKINILCGFIIAYSLHADIFTILDGQDSYKKFGWGEIKWVWDDDWDVTASHYFPEAFFFLVGCIATACFISFGSKFWHDLLDILLQIKNYRRILADPATYAIDNVKRLELLTTTYESDFIQAAYLEATNKYMAMDNVKAFSIKTDSNGYYFDLTVKQPDPGLGSAYQYILGDGTPINYRIKVYVMQDEIKALAFDLSSKIFNLTDLTKWGTLGCLVRPLEETSSTRYILTCCHNVVHPMSKLPDFHPSGVGAKEGDAPAIQIGKIYKAERTHMIDAALIEVDPVKIQDIEDTIPQIGKPRKSRTLKKADVGQVACYMFGANTRGENSPGTLTSVYTSIEITYSNDKFQLNDLFAVSNKDQSISKEGDSGSCVLDRDRNILGLVVAGNSRETFAIPIETILKKFQVQLA